MLLPVFEAPRLKIARARRHIVELEQATRDYLDSKPVVIVVERWSQPFFVPTSAWTARIKRDVPPDLSAILGDIVHNLRTALDLLANDLVRKAERNPTAVYFPFSHTKEELTEQIKKKHFDRAGERAVEFLKFVEPYRGGNVGLRAIHDMDVADKHQALIPILGTAVLDLSSRLGQHADAATKDQLRKWSTRIARDGQELVIMPEDWGPRQGTVIEANYVLWTRLNPKDVESGGHEVVWLMRELARVVENVVEEFAKL